MKKSDVNFPKLTRNEQTVLKKIIECRVGLSPQLAVVA